MPGREDEVGECKGPEVKEKKNKYVWKTAGYPEGLPPGGLEVGGRRESERNTGCRS